MFIGGRLDAEEPVALALSIRVGAVEPPARRGSRLDPAAPPAASRLPALLPDLLFSVPAAAAAAA